MAGGFSASNLAGPLIGGGLSLLGGVLQGNKANQQSSRQWELLQQEMNRRNMMQGIAAPSMLRAIGYRNPQQIQQYSQQIGAQGNAPTGQTPGFGTPDSGVSKGLSAAGTGLGITGGLAASGALGALGTPGIAGMTGATAGGAIPSALGLGGSAGLLGLGAATIPVVGGALAAGAYAAHKIGEGRRTANTFTKGVESPYGEILKKLSAGGGTLADLNAADQNYRNQAQQFIAHGGNEAKVAQQSLNNQALQQTIATLRRQLGG